MTRIFSARVACVLVLGCLVLVHSSPVLDVGVRVAINDRDLLPESRVSDDQSPQDAPASEFIGILLVLSEQYTDGTILVSMNGGYPSFLIAVDDLIKVKAPLSEDGIAVGSFIKLNAQQVAEIPTIAEQPISARPWADDLLIQRANAAASNPHPPKAKFATRALSPKQVDRSDGSASMSVRVLGPNEFDAPQLVGLTYTSYRSLRKGDSVIWQFSVLQGSAPLELINITLSGPFQTFKVITKYLTTPVGFVPSSTVTNGTISFKIVEPWIDGTYSVSTIVLRTQACPLNITATYSPRGSYGMISYTKPSAANVYGPSTSYISFFTSSGASSLTFGMGVQPTVIPPQLLRLTMLSSNGTLTRGDPLVFAYQVLQGTYPLAYVSVVSKGPYIAGITGFDHACSTALLGTAGTAAGGVVSGTLTCPTGRLLNGVYNFNAGPQVVLRTAPAAFRPEVVNTYYASTSSCYSHYVNPTGVVSTEYCGSPSGLSLTTSSYTFTVGNDTAPALGAPQLVLFNYTGPADGVGPGAQLSWDYEISLGSGPVYRIDVSLTSCTVSPCCTIIFNFTLNASSQTPYGTAAGRGEVPFSAFHSATCLPFPAASLTYQFVALQANASTDASPSDDTIVVSYYTGNSVNAIPYGVSGAPTTRPSGVNMDGTVFSTAGPNASCTWAPPAPAGAPPADPGTGPCEQQLSWQAITLAEDVTAWTGGLGTLMTDQVLVWVCVDSPQLPPICVGNSTSAAAGWRSLACYAYNEASQRFAYWGPNSVLKLVPAGAAPPPGTTPYFRRL